MSGERERMDELLIDEALWGLEDGEETELTLLAERHPDVDRDGFELVAARLHRDLLATRLEPIPDAVRARLLASARDLAVDPSLAAHPTPVQESSRESTVRAPGSPSWIPWLGWAAAAALALVLVRTGGSVASDNDPARNPRVDRTALLASATPAPWTTTDDELARGVTGDVVWDNERQLGFMRFRSLPANDPAREQYQLWIFDRERSDAHPVDGGVFDIAPGEPEVVIPIDAKLPVRQPHLFAVTLEPPGGVVVSTRERLLLTAGG